MIVKAVPDDHLVLTALTKRSKAYWGYSAELMAQWENQLTITPEYIITNETRKLLVDGSIIGYYSFLESDTETITLDNLFVDPQFIGKGYGKLFLEDAIEKARQQNFQAIFLQADPNAEDFYKRFGFDTIDKTETTVIGRYLPVMQLSLV